MLTKFILYNFIMKVIIIFFLNLVLFIYLLFFFVL